MSDIRGIVFMEELHFNYSWWTGSYKIATRRLRRPLAVPRRGDLDIAAASPAFGSVWRHRCGRCRPLVEEISKSRPPEWLALAC